MNNERFTAKTTEALRGAQALAEQRRHPQGTPEHLLAVLLEQEGTIVLPALRELGIEPALGRRENSAALDGLPTLGTGAEVTNFASELAQVLRAAESEMRTLGDEFISVEHVLLALSAHGSRAG